MTRIAVIQAPVWGIYEPPFSLSLLSAVLKREKYDVEPLDLNIELYSKRIEKYSNAWAIEQCMLWSQRGFVEDYFRDNHELITSYIDGLLDKNIDIAGFSVNSASKEASLKLAEMIREKSPSVKIIFGGHLFMQEEAKEIESILSSPGVDFIVYGEADQSFSKLISCLSENKDTSNCRGIYYIEKSGNIKRTEPLDPLKNLDELPFMDFSLLPLSKYENPSWLGKHLTIQTSRGCPWRCVFCGATTYWHGFRTMSGKRIYEEIKYHINNQPDIEHIEFMDLLFNGNMRTLEEFCDLMIANPPKPDLRWHVNGIIRPEMNRPILDKMKSAGCLRITYGIESGSPKVLKLMRKDYDIEVAHRVLKDTHEAGILIKANFMFGFPGETEEDFNMTLDLIKRSGSYINTAYPSFSFCVVESNSYMGKHMDEFNVKPNALDNLYWESEDGTNTYPERMRRWEIFSNYCRSKGIDIGIGLNTSLEQHRWLNLGYYYKSLGEKTKAIDAFNSYLKFDPENKAIADELKELNA